MRRIKLFSTFILMLFLNIGMAYSQTCPTGMIAYWKLEEVGSTILNDHISDHDATSSLVLSNVPDGKVGSAKYFDGTKSASVGNHPDFAFPVSGSFSIELWVKVPSSSSGTKVLVGKRDSNSSGPYWFVGINSGGRVIFEVQDSYGVYREIVSPSAITNDAWRHIVAVRDESTNGNYLYVDGSMVASDVYNYSGSFTSDGALTLGCLNTSSGIPSYFFTGNLDEVAIFNRALSSAEVTDHKQKGDQGIGYCDGFSPIFVSSPNVYATVNTLYSYTARATGLQTNMRYSLIQKPAGMTIDQITGQISWIPSSVSDDGYVSIVANNNTPPADTQSFRIFIAEAPDCPPGLSLLLKLEESSGPEYADFYGTHNATALISPTTTGGIVGGGQTFGSDTELDIPDNGTEFDWNYGDNWSVEFWMRTANTGTQVIVGRYRTDEYSDRAKWWVGINDNGEATFSLQDNSASHKYFEISGETYMPDNQWHHVIAVRDGSSQQNRLYIDGIEEAVVSTDYANSFKMDLPTPVSVGYWKRKTGENAYHYSGVIDEVAMFNRALYVSDASTYYNMGEPTGHCTPGNYAPIITSTPVTSATQDQPYTYLFEVEDIDVGDPITLSAVEKPDWLTFTHTAGQMSGTLFGTPSNADVAVPANVTLRVSDSKSQVDQPFVITVKNVNDIPVITSEPIDTVDEKAYYTYTLTVEDGDPDDVITMTPVAKPDWLTFNWTAGARTATLEGTPTDDDTGNNPINISISDGIETISESYILYVNAINDPPVITGQNEITVKEDKSKGLFVTDLIVEDPDNTLGEITLNVRAGNNYQFQGNVITPDDNFFGTLIVPVTVSDFEVESDVYSLVVTVESVNDLPMFTSTPDPIALTDRLYAYSINVEDADGDDIDLSADILPPWLTFYAANELLTGTPTAWDLGQHLVILKAHDGTNETPHQFIISVKFPTGIEDDESTQSFKLYPSPATDILYMEYDMLQDDAVASIYNNAGVLVKQVQIPKQTDKFNIEISELSSGSYYCVLTGSQINKTLKFLVSE